MLSLQEVQLLNEHLSEPYEIPEDSPYLSEEQRELSTLSFEQRSEWMAQWLYMAKDAENE